MLIECFCVFLHIDCVFMRRDLMLVHVDCVILPVDLLFVRPFKFEGSRRLLQNFDRRRRYKSRFGPVTGWIALRLLWPWLRPSETGPKIVITPQSPRSVAPSWDSREMAGRAFVWPDQKGSLKEFLEGRVFVHVIACLCVFGV
jgi:hypothetical protein